MIYFRNRSYFVCVSECESALVVSVRVCVNVAVCRLYRQRGDGAGFTSGGELKIYFQSVCACMRVCMNDINSPSVFALAFSLSVLIDVCAYVRTAVHHKYLYQMRRLA